MLLIILQVINAMLLTPVLLFLYLLASNALPPEHALKGWYKKVVGVIFTVCSVTSIFAVVMGVQA